MFIHNYLSKYTNWQLNLILVPSECTVKRPWFQIFLSSSTTQNIVSSTVRVHLLVPLISKFLRSSNLQNIALNSIRMHQYVPDFKSFLGVPTFSEKISGVEGMKANCWMLTEHCLFHLYWYLLNADFTLYHTEIWHK